VAVGFATLGFLNSLGLGELQGLGILSLGFLGFYLYQWTEILA
jgi:hypothetical protein